MVLYALSTVPLRCTLQAELPEISGGRSGCADDSARGDISAHDGTPRTVLVDPTMVGMMSINRPKPTLLVKPEVC